MVMRLQKALYGPRQTTRAWNGVHSRLVTRLGFVKIDFYVFLFIYLASNVSSTVIVVYVEDMLNLRFDLSELRNIAAQSK